MTAITLADLVQVTRQSISLYEKGRGSPGPDVVQRLAEKLGVPSSLFQKPLTPTMEVCPSFFRSRAAATKTDRTRALRLQSWLREIALIVNGSVELPEVDYPDFSPPDASHLTMGDIERIASEARRRWSMGDGPIANMVWLLENRGALIGRVELGGDMDGVSQWIDGRPYILLNTAKNCAVRSRMDAAHELGHLLLHRRVTDKRLSDKAGFQLVEKQAFRLGGAFLLPARVFGPHAYAATLDTFLNLKATWKVAIKAMIKRAGDLKIMSPDRQRRLYVAYSRRGWNGAEPLDDVLPVETPRLLPQAIELMIGQGGVSREQLLSDLSFSAPDIIKLASLSNGFFENRSASVHEFQPRLRSQPVAESSQLGTLISFPGADKGPPLA